MYRITGHYPIGSPTGRLFPETNDSQRVGRGSVGLWTTMLAPAAVMMTSL